MNEEFLVERAFEEVSEGELMMLIICDTSQGT